MVAMPLSTVPPLLRCCLRIQMAAPVLVLVAEVVAVELMGGLLL
jgi:hypothetical protein